MILRAWNQILFRLQMMTCPPEFQSLSRPCLKGGKIARRGGLSLEATEKRFGSQWLEDCISSLWNHSTEDDFLYGRLETEETRYSRRLFVIDKFFSSTRNSTVCQPGHRPQMVIKNVDSIM